MCLGRHSGGAALRGGKGRARLAILDWTDAVTFHDARIRAALERAGKPIGNLDLMIASHAVAVEATVVTNNVRHFASVPGLKVEEWK